MLKRRLHELLLITSTEYAELLLGVISTFTGIWLFFPVCHSGFCSWQTTKLIPESWGTMLLVAGLLKLYGVFYQKFKARKASCFIATLVWLFLSITFVSSQRPEFCTMAAPLTMVLTLFNGLIYIKLGVVRR
jgi:hypothetical protein